MQKYIKIRLLVLSTIFIFVAVNSVMDFAGSISDNNLGISTVLKITKTKDDLREYGGGRKIYLAQTQYLGLINNSNYWNGWRWRNVDIPADSIINYATLDLYSAGLADGNVAMVDFFGILNLNKDNFSSRHQRFIDLKKTKSKVSKVFDTDMWKQNQGFSGQTIDVTDIVQELVNANDWQSGSDIALIAHGSYEENNGYIGFSTYDRDASRGARLFISYQPKIKVVNTDNNNLTVALEDKKELSPIAPTDLKAVVIDSGRIKISWRDNSNNEDVFIVERKHVGDKSFSYLDTTSKNENFYIDSGLGSGIFYEYRVLSVNKEGRSIASNSAGATTTRNYNINVIKKEKTTNYDVQPIHFKVNNHWKSKVMAWVFPGQPACDAESEYSDGRKIHFLKPEYFTVTSGGVLIRKNEDLYGCNAYSDRNIALIKKHSDKQFVTISANITGMRSLFSSSAKTLQAIEKLVNFTLTSGFTGVEIDFENFSSWSYKDYVNYKVFLKTLGDKLHKNSKQLMVDVPPISNDLEQSYYLLQYKDLKYLPIDYVVIMAYDYQFDYGVGESITPNWWLEDVVIRAQTYIEPEKLVIGIPSYGYYGKEETFNITRITKQQAKEIIGFNTAKRQPGSFEVGWYRQGMYYSYQDTYGLNKQRELLEKLGVKYISVWHLGGNDWFSGKEEIN